MPCNIRVTQTNTLLLLLRRLGRLLRRDLLLERSTRLVVTVHVVVVHAGVDGEALEGRGDRVRAEVTEDVDDLLVNSLRAARADHDLGDLALVAALRVADESEVRAALAHEDTDAALVAEGAVVAVVAASQVPGLLAELHAVAVLDVRVAVAHDLPDKRRRHLSSGVQQANKKHTKKKVTRKNRKQKKSKKPKEKSKEKKRQHTHRQNKKKKTMKETRTAKQGTGKGKNMMSSIDVTTIISHNSKHNLS